MTKNNHNMTSAALGRAVMIALMIIPTAISIFVALEVKKSSKVTDHVINYEPEIVCFDPEVCAIEVYGKWYKIDGVIIQEDVVPEEYRLNDLVKQAHEHRAAEEAKDKPKTQAVKE